MTMLASQITSLTVVYSIVHSCVNQRKHQSSASLAFVREIHRGPVNFPHKWPVTRKMFPFDDVIMKWLSLEMYYTDSFGWNLQACFLWDTGNFHWRTNAVLRQSPTVLMFVDITGAPKLLRTYVETWIYSGWRAVQNIFVYPYYQKIYIYTRLILNLGISQSSYLEFVLFFTLQWRHNERDGVSNHQRLNCLLNRLFQCRLQKISKFCVTGLCERNPPVTGVSLHRGGQ